MFNIQSILYQILASLSTVLGDKYEAVKPRVEEIITDSKERFTELAEAALSTDPDKKIPLDELGGYLKDELTVLEDELLEMEVVAAKTAEDAINGAITTFTGIIQGLLPKTGE